MEDVDSQDMPGALVEEYLQRERGTRALLDELEKLSIEGEDEELRERIRTFADNNQEVFYTVALALTNSKHFFGDVESQLGIGPADKLRDLADTYPSLAEPFSLVRMEESNERRNPITGFDVTTTYHAEEEVPIVGYTAFSGNVELYDHRGSPQEVLQTASYLVQATNDSLEAALQQNHSVNTDELSELIDRHEKLESELNALRDHIDELRRKPVGDE
jgi:predicted nuclease with TOPRIM domain